MAGRKVFVANEVLTAAEVNGYLMDQSVMVFADASARTAAIGTATEGMFTYLEDTNALEYFDGADWSSLDSLPSQTGEAGKYLTTNGTAASWATITTDPTPQIFLLMGA